MDRNRIVILFCIYAATAGVAACNTSITSPPAARHAPTRQNRDSSSDSISLGGYIVPSGHR
jgi:hypothetical protein